MSTSLYVVFFLLFGQIDFVIPFSTIFLRKKHFCIAGQNFITEKSIFGQFEDFFLMVWFFPKKGLLIHLSTIKNEHNNKMMSSLAGLNKSLFSFSEKYCFWSILTTQVQFRSRFSQRTGKFQKVLDRFLGGRCQKHCVKFWASHLQEGAGGLVVLQVNFFQTPRF